MLGHEYGDQVLVAVSERLRVLAGAAKLIARLSGDEFAILITGQESPLTAEQLAGRLSWSFANTALPLKSRSQSIGISIGGAVFPADGQTAEGLLANSHLALCKTKSISRGEYTFFEREIREELEARFALEAELAAAVRKGEFELYYQPQFNLPENRIVGAEALIRWRHPERGLLFPGSFMPVVNTSPISDEVAAWVMAEACRQGRKWQDLGHDIRMAVNLSPSQFRSNDLARQVKQVIAETGFSPTLLELEVTEDILLSNDELALDVFRQVQELGIRIAFDDFGTGYGSFSHLKKFPLNKLKIDKSFVFELCKNPDDAAIVASTIGLCRQLNLSLTAEGIEDAETVKLLTAMGCEEGQGYYFSKAIPAADFEKTFLFLAARENIEDRSLSVA
jgi:predicted signal transduction protein with EAL and GGDEF domain